jgi:predicted branched-subunit amino acid permease
VVVVVVTGGVPGLTIVVAAVAVAVVVTILVGVNRCSWLRVVMLERCVFAGSSSWGSPL